MLNLEFSPPPENEFGIYAIFLRLPPLEEISAIDTDNTWKNIEHIGRKCWNSLRASTIHALVKTTGREGNLGKSYSGSLHDDGEAFETILTRAQRDRISPEDFYEFLTAAITLYGPIYIGVAERQSIASRLRQHRFGFRDSHTSNSFATRARKAGLTWSDLRFGWKALPSGSLRTLESTILTFQNPILSMR